MLLSRSHSYQSGMQGCSPGIGAAINCDLPLVNVVDTWSKIDRGGLHRDKDPGAGAITPYFDRKSRATRSIRPGEELYIGKLCLMANLSLFPSAFCSHFPVLYFRLRRKLL